MAEGQIRVYMEGSTYVIELDRPEALNALTSAMFRELEPAILAAEHSDARAIFICSSSAKAFSVGTDLKEIAQYSPEEIDLRNEMARRIFGTLRTNRLLSFAHICGHALGGGLELALACSFRLLSPYARLGLPEIKLGAIPAYGGIHTLSHLVRDDIAMDMLTSGRSLNATEAMNAGLGTRQMASAERHEALDVVREFTSRSLAAQTLARKALTASRSTALSAVCAEEIDAIQAAVRISDFREGVAAFLEKRDPRFCDK